MKKTNLNTYTKDFFIEMVWFWSSVAFILFYAMTGLKTVTGFGLNRKFLHILSCLSLTVTYGSCIFFKSSAVNIQKLLKDSNFRCLLVVCSLLGVDGMLIPMVPFLLMSSLAIASYIVKNKNRFEKAPVLQTSLSMVSYKDQITLMALKIEVISLPLIFFYLLLGSADLFVFVSYASLVWFEYSTNPCMKKAVQEILETVNKAVASPNVPNDVRIKYDQAKKYIAGKIPPYMMEGTKTASS